MVVDWTGWQHALGWALMVGAAGCGRSNLSTWSSLDDGATSSSSTSGSASTTASGGGGASSGGMSTTGMGGLNMVDLEHGSTVADTWAPSAFACSAVERQQFDPVNMHPFRVSEQLSKQVTSLLELMEPSAKYAQMMGVDGSSRNYRDIQRSPDVEVAQVGVVRGYRYRDGGRGVNLDAGQDNRETSFDNFSTAFPSPSLRAASWDLDLERRIGEAIGDETAVSRNNLLTAPTMNLLRHPYWGRAQETYGEDTYLVGRMASAFTVGVQQYVAACARYFAAYNVEQNRASHNALVSEQALREIYSRHFEMVVQDAGVACVMAAPHSVNDIKSTQNRHLLRDILKAPSEQGGIGFEGFVLSDWWGMPGGQNWPDPALAQAVAGEAVLAGTDVEMPWALHYYDATLANADPALVEDAVRRVLTQKCRFETALATDPFSHTPPSSRLTDEGSLAPNPEHEELAEEAVIKSAVLLANGLDEAPVLPLTDASHIVVLGPKQDFKLISSSVPKSCTVPEGEPSGRECSFQFALDPALGDRGTNRINADPERSVGPIQGIASIAGAGRYVTSGSTPEVPAAADTVVVVVGYTPADEGEEYPIAEGGDRRSLDLPEGHNEFVAQVLDSNRPTIVVIESGSIVNMPWLEHQNRRQATIWAGYPGQHGGLGLGKLLFGLANFSGKLPMAWPAERELLPFKDSADTTAMAYFFGYREYDRRQYLENTDVDLVFPFGHGLSYSSFEYSNLTLPCEVAEQRAVFEVSIDIENRSALDGEEVAMLFVKPPAKPAGITGERPHKELKSFARVSVPAGETVTARLPLRIADLRRWEGDEDGRWVVDSGDYTILVGKNAADAEASGNTASLTIKGD